MSMIRFHSSSPYSAVGAGFLGSMPALLNAKSSRPKTSTHLARAAFTSWARITSHRTASARPPLLLDQVGRLLVALLRHVGGHHAGCLASERQRRRAADPARGPGHERNLPCEFCGLVRCHRFPSTR